MGDLIIARNVSRLRREKGLSQGAFASRAGVSRAGIQKIERGQSEPRVDTLRKIAGALEVAVMELVQPVPQLDGVRFRSAKRLKVREGVIAEAAQWLKTYSEVENVVFGKLTEEELAESGVKKLDFALADLRNKYSRSRSRKEPNRKKAIDAAMEAREALGLDQEPFIRDISGLIEERGGVKVLSVVRGSDGYFGMSVSDEVLGPAIVVNTWERISVERWIFTAAHELGHLVLHPRAYKVEETAESDLEEKEANWFGSYFSMPDDLFDSEWADTRGRDLVSRVLKIKGIFRVSYKTVLSRLYENMGDDRRVWSEFSDAFFRRTGRRLSKKDEPLPLDRQDYSEGMRSKEPDSLPSWDLKSDRLALLVRIALENGLITRSLGAKALGIPLTELKEWRRSWRLEEGCHYDGRRR